MYPAAGRFEQSRVLGQNGDCITRLDDYIDPNGCHGRKRYQIFRCQVRNILHKQEDYRKLPELVNTIPENHPEEWAKKQSF